MSEIRLELLVEPFFEYLSSIRGQMSVGMDCQGP